MSGVGRKSMFMQCYVYNLGRAEEADMEAAGADTAIDEQRRVAGVNIGDALDGIGVVEPVVERLVSMHVSPDQPDAGYALLSAVSVPREYQISTALDRLGSNAGTMREEKDEALRIDT